MPSRAKHKLLPILYAVIALDHAGIPAMQKD